MVYQKNENGSYSNISTPKKGGVIHAIGEIYIQYPGEADPNTLFPNMTWENVSSSYAGAFFRTKNGAFFRAEGGNAQSFNCTAAQPMGNSLANLSVGGTTLDGTHFHLTTCSMTPYYCACWVNLRPIEVKANYCSGTSSQIMYGKPSVDGYPTYVYPGSSPYSCCYYCPTPQVGNATLWSNPSQMSESYAVKHRHIMCIFTTSDSVETRPANYTIRIWKRTA